MNQPLYVHTGGVQSLSDIHGRVAAAMSQLAGSALDEAALQTAYGTISSAFTSALGEALPSRDGTFRATQTSSQTIGELLQRAAQMYERGDQQDAEKLRAAAEAMAGSGDACGAGSGGGESAGGGTGADGGAAGGGGAQMASQVGQQVGQLAQGVAQSVQGLAQGLTQLPQQIMQGVQGMVGSASKASGSEDLTGDEAQDEKDEDERVKHEESESEEKRAAERREQHQAAPDRNDDAQPGRTADAGRAPEPPPAPKPAPPAQTRPQQAPL